MFEIGQKIIVPIVSIVFITTASKKHKFFVFTNTEKTPPLHKAEEARFKML